MCFTSFHSKSSIIVLGRCCLRTGCACMWGCRSSATYLVVWSDPDGAELAEYALLLVAELHAVEVLLLVLLDGAALGRRQLAVFGRAGLNQLDVLELQSGKTRWRVFCLITILDMKPDGAEVSELRYHSMVSSSISGIGKVILSLSLAHSSVC